MSKLLMMDRVVIYDVPNEGKKCLSRDVWIFSYFERRGLILDRFAHEERDSLRKNFQSRREYNRLTCGNRDYRIEVITEEDAPLPQWVIDQAKDEFMANFQVGKWQRP